MSVVDAADIILICITGFAVALIVALLVDDLQSGRARLTAHWLVTAQQLFGLFGIAGFVVIFGLACLVILGHGTVSP